jgi:hypothetical protein
MGLNNMQEKCNTDVTSTIKSSTESERINSTKHLRPTSSSDKTATYPQQTATNHNKLQQIINERQ